MVIKVVIFDIGGVCVGSPLHAINEYEKKTGLPHNYLNFMIARWKSPSPMNLLEQGDIPAIDDHFFELFEAHLSDPEGYAFFWTTPLAPKGLSEAELTRYKSIAPKINARDLWSMMMEAASVPNTPLIKVIESLKTSGKYKVWALTNNFPAKLGLDHVIHPLFHRVIGSVQMRMRKPDPRIYDYVLAELLQEGVQPNEVVFLDDIGANLKAAKKLGINTIQVDFRTTPNAIKALDKILGGLPVRANI